MAGNVFAQDFKRLQAKNRLYIDDNIFRAMYERYGAGILARLVGAAEAGVLINASTVLKNYMKTGSLDGINNVPAAAANDPRVAGAYNALTRPQNFDNEVAKLFGKNLPGYVGQSAQSAGLNGAQVYVDDNLIAGIFGNLPSDGAKNQFLFMLREAVQSGLIDSNSPALDRYMSTGQFDLTGVQWAAPEDPRLNAIRLLFTNPSQVSAFTADLARRGLPGYVGRGPGAGTGGALNRPNAQGLDIPPTAVVDLTDEQLDALQIMKEQLGDSGLTGLDQWLADQLRQGAPAELIMMRLEDTPQYAQRFPGIVELRKLQAQNPSTAYNIPTEEEYVAFERGVASIAAQAGVFNLVTRQNITDMVTNGVSLASFARRIEEGYMRLNSTAPEVRQFFMNTFGMAGDQALVSYFVDADNTEQEIMKAVNLAEVGGAATIAGLGLNANTLSQVSDIGISFSQALQGFTNTAATRFLTNRLANETAGMSLDTLVQSQFGLSGESVRAVDRRRRERMARSGGLGGVSSSGSMLAFGSAQ